MESTIFCMFHFGRWNFYNQFLNFSLFLFSISLSFFFQFLSLSFFNFNLLNFFSSTTESPEDLLVEVLLNWNCFHLSKFHIGLTISFRDVWGGGDRARGGCPSTKGEGQRIGKKGFFRVAEGAAKNFWALFSKFEKFLALFSKFLGNLLMKMQ